MLLAAMAALCLLSGAAAQERSIGEVQAACLLKLVQHIALPAEPAKPQPPAPREVEPAKPQPPPPRENEPAKPQPPAPPPTLVASIGLVGDDETVRTALRVLKDKSIGGAKVEVVQLTMEQVADRKAVAGCRLVYFAELPDEKSLRALLTGDDRPATILVSPSPGFAKAGGDVQLFVHQGHVQMEINAGVIRAKGLRPNPQLVALSRKAPDR